MNYDTMVVGGNLSYNIGGIIAPVVWFFIFVILFLEYRKDIHDLVHPNNLIKILAAAYGKVIDGQKSEQKHDKSGVRLPDSDKKRLFDKWSKANKEYIESEILVQKGIIGLKPKLRIGKNMETALRIAATWYMAFEFERIYRLVFGTQLALLVELSNKKELTHVSTIRDFLGVELQKRNLSQNSVDFYDWIGFLTRKGLVFCQNNDFYKITPYGICFLNHVVQNEYDLKTDML